jgi:hypothetical protein
MQRVILYVISLLLALGSFVARAAGDMKAEQLLAQARAALGGERNLSKVQGLSCTGTFQRTMQDRQLSGELTIDLQLPDKMLRTESMSPMGDMTVITEQGINGEKVLRSQRAVNAPPGAVIRMGQAPGGDAEAQALRNARADLARTAVVFLLTSPASMPLEFSYRGEAESADGKADVLDAKGPGNFAARIFLDKSNHRPLMLAYKGVAPRMVIQTQRLDAPPDAAALKHADQAAAAAQPPPQAVDINVFLDDYRQVDGLWLPHHVSRSIDGTPMEEWTLKSFKVNPSFKTDTFSAR